MFMAFCKQKDSKEPSAMQKQLDTDYKSMLINTEYVHSEGP